MKARDILSVFRNHEHRKKTITLITFMKGTVEWSSVLDEENKVIVLSSKGRPPVTLNSLKELKEFMEGE